MQLCRSCCDLAATLRARTHTYGSKDASTNSLVDRKMPLPTHTLEECARQGRGRLAQTWGRADLKGFRRPAPPPPTRWGCSTCWGRSPPDSSRGSPLCFLLAKKDMRML